MSLHTMSTPMRRRDTAHPEQIKPFGPAVPIAFTAIVALLASRYQWPTRWILSGAAPLTAVVLYGASQGNRVLSAFPLWSIISTLNLIYAICATSWLFYAFFAIWCYPVMFITCLFQFDHVARGSRRNMRRVLRSLQFVNDKIAFFDIPALEIDVDVDGLMVVRGLEFSLSTLTIIAYGIEVGIKLSDDMELAISTEKVVIPLFRRIEIGEVFANLKGGEREMTFGDLKSTKDADGDAVMLENTPLLKAAAANADTSRPNMVKMKSYMTGGDDLKDSTAKEGLRSMKRISPDDSRAGDEFKRMVDWINESNTIAQARKQVRQDTKLDDDEIETPHDLRAAMCSKMHTEPSVPHPPKHSIKVTTLQNLSSKRARGMMHRMPMLLRLILNPISYFHPVSIKSITVAGSGQWISTMLKQNIFKEYAEDNKELRKLEGRVLEWLADANFVFELADITGIASVPFISSFDINTLIKVGDVIAYRTLEDSLEQVLRLGGADCAFAIPSYLLPHHEHLLPPIPSKRDKEKLKEEVDEADGRPKEVQAERDLEQAEKDESNVQISVHARLPACFSQDLLDFIAALVKATKVVELEKAPGALDEKMSSLKDLTQALSKGVKESMKKTVTEGIVNDKWIAKMVGKITKKLEEAQGDVGYSGDIPVKLEKYRLPEGHPENNKLLP